MRLSPETLHHACAETPRYDRDRVTPGIVHLGVGNFHRAHQAVYADDSLAQDPSWGIRGVSLRRPGMRDALAPQGGLYTVAVKDGEGTRARVVGSLVDTLVAPEDPGAVLDALSDPAIRIVSLTVTEKGYCHDPATGDLDTDHPGIRADLEADMPSTAPGLIVEALRRRRAAGAAPFTVLSCDNLPSNGTTLRRIAVQYAALGDDRLAAWLEATVAFPATMVDRIVPATSDEDRAAVESLTGLRDAWPVMTEPFTQWVVEDAFPEGRPALPGVEFTSDVEPYERMKLRMLNGAHSTLAYLGQLAGRETVADAMDDARIADVVGAVMAQAAATLTLPSADLAAYADALTERFRNPALRHRTAQIAMDGSQKVPQRLLATIRDAHARGLPWDAPATGVAAWIAYLRGRAVDDPLAGRLSALPPEPEAHADAVMSLRAVFGDLADAAWFCDTVREKAVALSRDVAATTR